MTPAAGPQAGRGFRSRADDGVLTPVVEQRRSWSSSSYNHRVVQAGPGVVQEIEVLRRGTKIWRVSELTMLGSPDQSAEVAVVHVI